MHYTLALAVDVLALILLWIANASVTSIIEAGRSGYALFFGAIKYSWGPVWHRLCRSGSIAENQRIAFVAQLQRFGEGICLFLLVPTILWAATIVYIRDGIRNNDESFPNILGRYRPPHNDLECRVPSGRAHRPILVIRNSFNRQPSARPPANGTRLNLLLEYVMDALCYYAARDPNMMCNLCWTNLRVLDEIMVLPCSHRHACHARCGILSVMQRGKCPVCKEWIVDQI